MSPEQATGDQSVGSSTDTYALGSVLYEMLVGDPPYSGSTAQAVLGKIIAGEPVSAAKHRPSVPANVDAAIRCALEKLPADRFTSAQDFVRALGDEHFQYGEPATAGAGSAVGPWKRRTMTLAAITAVLTIALGWSLMRIDPPEPPGPVTRVSVLMGEPQSFDPTFGVLDLSTDGSLMVYKGQGDEGQSQVWLRRWDALEATPIRNTEGAEGPVISPDGGEVVFGTGFPGSIRVVPLEGGVLRTLTDSAWCCPSWSPEGDWVYYVNLSQGLSRVPASGGPSEVVTQVDAGDVAHGFQDALPGGSGVLYQAEASGQANQRIQALDLETDEVKDLTPGTTPRYIRTGHLLFMDANEGTLLAAPFDAKNLELTGAAVPVAEGVLRDQFGFPYFDVSASGRLVYRTGAAITNHVTPVWVERDGTFREIDPGWTLPYEDFSTNFALSPDATRLAVSARGLEGTVDIYVKELDTGPLTRLTFEGTMNRLPTWSLDGQSVSFVSNRAGQDDLWMRRADGGGRAELVLDMDEPIKEALYSPDGEWLLFILSDLDYGGSIYGIRLGVDSVPTPLVVAEEDWRATEMALSPDGRWLAYSSNMLGGALLDDASYRVWVQPFPDVASGRWQMSATTSDRPEWAHSGRELFYNGDFDATGTQQDFMVAEVSVEPIFAVGRQRVLFSGVGYTAGVDFRQPYGHERKVGLDDQRFVMLRNMELEADNELILVDNWFEELKERMGN